MSRKMCLKENTITGFSVKCLADVFFIAAILLSLLMYAAPVIAAGSGGIEFEIPISQLNKEAKEVPPKQSASESQKKKKNDAGKEIKKGSHSKRSARKTKEKKKNDVKSQETIGDAGVPSKQVDLSIAPPKHSVSEGTAPVKAPLVPLSPSGNIRIDHEPYSFIVAGKSTVINAVVYRETDLKDVTCKVIVAGTGEESLVKMTKVKGSRFTYTTTLAGPAPGSSSLRYTIVVTDSSNKESSSPEYVVPVTDSLVVPGWQH